MTFVTLSKKGAVSSVGRASRLHREGHRSISLQILSKFNPINFPTL